MKRNDFDSDLALGMDIIAPEGFGGVGGDKEENLKS